MGTQRRMSRSVGYWGVKRTNENGERLAARQAGRVRRVGVRGKLGSKARRNFQQSRSLCSRAAKGVPSHVYNVRDPSDPSDPSDPRAFLSFPPRLRTGCTRACRENSIASKPLRAIFTCASSRIFPPPIKPATHPRAGGMSFDCHSHESVYFDTGERPFSIASTGLVPLD